MQYYLIDDDLLIRKSWEFAAKKAKVNFQSFSSPAMFMDCCEHFPKDSLIYIDQELSDGMLGTIEAKQIAELGFINLYLATGHDPITLEKPSYIIKITGKKPPF